MKLLFPILLLLLIISCREKKGLPEDEIDGMTDSACSIVPGTALVNFKHISVEDIIDRLKSKIDSIEIDNFGEEDFQNMQDSILKNVFNLQKALAKGELVIDTVNLLTLKDNLKYYVEGTWTPLPLQWNKTSNSIANFTYHKGDGFEVGYEFTPCIQEFISAKRVYKRRRKGEQIPDNLDSIRRTSIDRVEAVDCLLNLEIVIQIGEKPPFFGYKKRLYHVVFQDTATVYALEGLLGDDAKP